MKKLSISSKIVIIAVAVMFFAIAIFSYATKTHANPSGYIRKTSATASTTLTFMTPGTATTSAVIDCGLANASATGCDGGALLVAFTSSSSVSTLLINQEFSQGVAGNTSIDCVATPTACDWYQSNQTFISSFASTTLAASVGQVDVALIPQYNWDFASTSVGGAAVLTNNNLGTTMIPVISPTRYTRFVFSLKVLTNGNGAVYWETVFKKETP